jgi:cytochrome c-type biogenesis protein
MLEQVPGAFLAGLVSIVFPCVLPLVPGYLSAISALEADRLGEPGVWRRVTWATLPFIAGFTVVFVLLGSAAAAVGGAIDDKRLQNEVAGFVLVVIGLGFVGLLPWPERALAPGLTERARRRGSSALLGGAFAVCAAPCIGAVLASILVLAGSAGSIVRGIVLLLAYSLGLGAAFVVAGVVLGSVLVLASKADTALRGAFLLAVYSAGLGLGFLLAGLAFARAMAAFRWLRDHYGVLRVVGGTSLVGLGLLLFFHYTWWLYTAVDKAFALVGLDSL